MGEAPLHDPTEHRPLAGADWSESAARTAIAEIAADAVAAYRGPREVWANHPADLEPDDPDRPMRNVYLGAAGVAWALDQLARAGLGPPLPGVAELVATLADDYRAEPELTDLETGTPPPPPGLMFGESGILLALEALDPGGDPDRPAALARCVARNARNPARELCWGSPGTLRAAGAMWRADGDPAWRRAWRDGATWLLEQWTDPVWCAELYGERRRYVGAGHGFAGTAAMLLADAELLNPEPRAAMLARIAFTANTLAIESEGDGLAQWPALADLATERRPLQWCHGAPGIVVSLAGLPAEPALDRRLAAGGELTWRAGPLRKGSGLCHGTAGNAYALLALHARTGEAHWLARTRASAMDAATEVATRRAREGRGRYSLFTGDLGVALLLAACLTPTQAPGFPFLSDPLGSRSGPPAPAAPPASG